LLMQAAGQQSVQTITEPGEQRKDEGALKVVFQQFIDNKRQERHARQRELVGRRQNLGDLEGSCFRRAARRRRTVLHVLDCHRPFSFFATLLGRSVKPGGRVFSYATAVLTCNGFAGS
jgi:hypothetical protein